MEEGLSRCVVDGCVTGLYARARLSVVLLHVLDRAMMDMRSRATHGTTTDHQHALPEPSDTQYFGTALSCAMRSLSGHEAGAMAVP